MGAVDRTYVEVRSIGRRKDDFIVRDLNKHYQRLIHLGQIVTSEMNMDILFDIIIEQTNEIMACERSTLFLHDDKSDELWSYVATGMEKNQIRIPVDAGLSGWVFRSRTPTFINDTYDDSRFYPEIDQKSGFHTTKIASVPLINRKNHCIGTLEALNKKTGDFDADDLELLTAVSHYVAIALENARLYADINKHSEALKKTLVRNETLEKVKSQLTKFVPPSVAVLAQKNPDDRAYEKIPMQVSILFIDIQDFSKLTEDFDQRVINDMIESHFSTYLDCIGKNRGEVIETTGDGLMVMFKEGKPESNAMDAVSAGLEIISENKRLNDEFNYPWGKVLLHMGINSGEAWVGATKMTSIIGERWFYTASGLVTVIASRIGALSSENRLYIGPETFGYLRDKCRFEYVGEKEFKNIKKAIPIYMVKGCYAEKFLSKGGKWPW